MAEEDLKQLRQDFEEHREEGNAKWACILEATERNCTALEKMTVSAELNNAALEELTKNTAGVVQVYSDLQGAARVGIALQKAVVWLSKWGVLGSIAAAALTFLVDHFSPV